MCIIVYKPDSKVLREETLRNCFQNNPDGAGFAAYTEEEGLVIRKGFFTFEEFMQAYEPYAGDNRKSIAVLHFRIATHGTTNVANCHPFVMESETDNTLYRVALVHNGILQVLRDDLNDSDTKHFAERLLGPAIRVNPTIWLDENFKNMIEGLIGFGNKFAMIDSFGNVNIYNENRGVWDSDCWFSNSSFRSSYGFTHICWDMGYTGDCGQLHLDSSDDAWTRYTRARNGTQIQNSYKINDRRRFTNLGTQDLELEKTEGIQIVKKLVPVCENSGTMLEETSPTFTAVEIVTMKPTEALRHVGFVNSSITSTEISEKLATGFSLIAQDGRQTSNEDGYLKEPENVQDEVKMLQDPESNYPYQIEVLLDDHELDSASASIVNNIW